MDTHYHPQLSVFIPQMETLRLREPEEFGRSCVTGKKFSLGSAPVLSVLAAPPSLHCGCEVGRESQPRVSPRLT